MAVERDAPSQPVDHADPSSVLLLESPLSTGCDDPFCAANGDGPVSLLSVLYDGRVAERAQRLRAHSDAVTTAAFVAVDPVDGAVDSAAVRTVSSPADLTGVGMAVSDWVSSRDADERAVVCLDGVSTLLQYASVEDVFHFLHALVSRCRQRNVAVHAHLAASAHRDQTVAKLRQVFDECRDAGATVETTGHSGPVATDGGRETR